MRINGYTTQELTRLVRLMDTKELDIKLIDKKEIEINEPEKPKYKTDENNDIIRNNYGCYAIYNEELKIIYIGETTKNFHNRWLRHYYNYNEFGHDKRALIMHPDTICTIIAISKGDKKETEYMEAEAIKWYKKEYPDWTILGGTYKDNCYSNKGAF